MQTPPNSAETKAQIECLLRSVVLKGTFKLAAYSFPPTRVSVNLLVLRERETVQSRAAPAVLQASTVAI